MRNKITFLLTFLPIFLFGQKNVTYHSAVGLPKADEYVVRKFLAQNGIICFEILVFKNDSLRFKQNVSEYVQNETSFTFWNNGKEIKLLDGENSLRLAASHSFSKCLNGGGSVRYDAQYVVDNPTNSHLRVLGYDKDGQISETYDVQKGPFAPLAPPSFDPPRAGFSCGPFPPLAPPSCGP